MLWDWFSLVQMQSQICWPPRFPTANAVGFHRCEMRKAPYPFAEVGLHFQDLGSIKGAAHVPPPAIDLSQLKNMMHHEDA